MLFDMVFSAPKNNILVLWRKSRYNILRKNTETEKMGLHWAGSYDIMHSVRVKNTGGELFWLTISPL